MKFKSAISWFEIPATDYQRAINFYEAIFDCSLNRMDMDNFKMAMFEVEDGTTGGAVVHAPGYYETGSQGPLIYLNGSPDLQNVLDKIEAAGGKILQPKTQISPQYGYMAIFTDTEGNKIGLHSMQ
jgi:predicted enzyme related to lactoylglutathione lyase